MKKNYSKYLFKLIKGKRAQALRQRLNGLNNSYGIFADKLSLNLRQVLIQWIDRVAPNIDLYA